MFFVCIQKLEILKYIISFQNWVAVMFNIRVLLMYKVIEYFE